MSSMPDRLAHPAPTRILHETPGPDVLRPPKSGSISPSPSPPSHSLLKPAETAKCASELQPLPKNQAHEEVDLHLCARG